MFDEIRKSTAGAFDKAKLLLNPNATATTTDVTAVSMAEDHSETASQTPPQPDRLEELAEFCPQLTYQQRIIGFAVSFSLGYLIAFFSFRFFIHLIEGNPLPFALNYTFGHVLQLLASTFLCGPKRQFKNMFDKHRRDTSIVYLSCLVLTLLFVFIPLPGPLKLIILLLLMMIQFCASVWYSLSYIPYGRRTVTQCAKRQLGIEDASSSGYANITLPSIRFGTSTV